MRVKSHRRRSSEFAAQAKTRDRACALASDHAGHIVGLRFTADQGIRNLFPQNGNFNTGAYKTMENEWAAWTKNGGEVHFKIDLKGGTADRPGPVMVNYEVRNQAGQVVYDNRFGNPTVSLFRRSGLAVSARTELHTHSVQGYDRPPEVGR